MPSKRTFSKILSQY